MAKIAKSIRVEETLHNLVKSMGAARGLGVEESYEKALQYWASPESGPSMSPEESERVDVLLRLMRFGNAAVAAGVLAMLDSQKDTLPPLSVAQRKSA
jgi:hypothetical protein